MSEPVTPLAVTVAGLRLKNPVIAGASEATMDGAGIRAAVESGAAAVVAKSMNESPQAARQLENAEYQLLDEAWEPLPWGPAPRTASLFSRSGLPGVPFDEWVRILAEEDAHARGRDAYVLGSLIVLDPADAARQAKEMEAAGLRWIEVNVGAPHAEEASPNAIRAARQVDEVGEMVRPVREAVTVPLTVKLGAEGDLVAMTEAALGAGADAVCFAGRHLGFVPDLTTRRPILGTFGAIGGGWALPLTLRWIAKARRRFGRDVQLIGTSGARDGRDVARFLLSGARAVEMTSVLMTDGPGALTRAIADLERYLAEQGTTAQEIIGEAADHTLRYDEVTKERRT